MAHYNFDKDLLDGQQAEQEAIEKLKVHFSITDDADFEIYNKTEYDIKIISKNLTFEVKNDLMATKTGNVAIEYECRGNVSGINATEADFWLQKYNNKFHMVETSKLKDEILTKRNFDRDFSSGGGDAGSNTKMYLVAIPKFETWGVEL